MAGAGGAAGAGGTSQELDGCASDEDCEEGACIPMKFEGIPGEVVGKNGACTELPAERYLKINKISPVRLTGDIVPRDPASDSYESFAPDLYDVSQSLRTFRFEGGPYGSQDLLLPGDPMLPQFRFRWQAEVVLRVVAGINASMPIEDIECRLVVDSSGNLLDGGVLRGPGEILCSRTNWQAPQSEDEPGILVGLEVTETPEPANP